MNKGHIIKLTLLITLLMMTAADMPLAQQKTVMWPTPSVRDQIFHTQGNIGVAVVNFGMLGDVYGDGVPSGRWPANSNRDYLSSIEFWIGAINESGDTLLANPSEDYNPIQHLNIANDGYGFLVSNDTSTFDYNPNDTVGAGIGFPAHGWRIWDVDTRAWEYNEVYHQLSSSFHPGGPVSVQESICRYGDDAAGSPAIGLEVTQTIRQWNYSHIKNIIVVTLQITNSSGADLTDVAFGLYCDLDIGGTDLATGENGRLGDLVAVDTTLDLAWTYDKDGYDPGWGPGVNTGFMGTVILSTPGDVGMTSFNTGEWEQLPTNDLERFRMINGTDIIPSLPPTDQYYVQGTRGISLASGETAEITFALIAGANEEKLKTVAVAAKDLFNQHFISQRPPDNPTVMAAPGDRMTAISWNNTAEISVDPATNSTDFQGYKIYKSDDRGQSWGFLTGTYDEPEYIPEVRYELDNLNRISRTYVDSNLLNGVEYWYAVAGFDSTELEADVFALTPNNAINIVRVLPRTDPLGYAVPQSTIEHVYSGSYKSPDDAVEIIIVDEHSVTGSDYIIKFSEDCANRYWHLINESTGDTVLADQQQFTGPKGTYPIADGIQVIVPFELEADSIYMSQFGAVSDSSFEFETMDAYAACYEHYRNDFEIRFTATGSIAHEFFDYRDLGLQTTFQVPFEIWNVSTNTQVDVWITDFAIDGQWTPGHGDFIIFTNYPYDNGTFHEDAYADYFVWLTRFQPAGVPLLDDAVRINGSRIPGADDEYSFSSSKISAADAIADLDRIHVVPNPYIGRAQWETGDGLRKLQFVNLPNECTIRVYTLAGELIRQLDHDNGTGTEEWDLLSESYKGIAAGVYLFNVESQYGNYNGKFAVIK
ncbi:MAG: hypothetical protein KAR42_11620 [candidate division Zixibacteria bacterium]|nr:hypothetical protein [candidate division Zixibacteria bacterium]